MAVKTSIFEHVEEGLQKNPDGPAVVVMHQSGNHLSELVEHTKPYSPATNGAHQPACLNWTYRQLHGAALKLSAGLLAHGVRPDSTVVTLIPNRVEYSLLLWTSTIVRFTLACLDYGALTAPRFDELDNFMQTLNPDVVIVPDAEGAKAVDTALRDIGQRPQLCVVLDGPESPSWMTLLGLAQSSQLSPTKQKDLLEQARNDDPERIQFVLFTSGTSSGNPKGCPRRVGNTCHVLQQYARDRPMEANTRTLLANANFRVIAPSFSLATWKAGGATVMPGEGFAPGNVLDAIEEHGLTLMMLAPASLHALIAEPSFKSRNKSSMKSVLLGGDMITKDLLAKAQNSFPTSLIAVAHGATEGAALFRWPFANTPIEQVPYFGEIAPLGRVTKGARVRMWDHENKRVARRGEPGELHACCGSIIRGYLGGVNQESFYTDDKGQWYKTGDLGMIDKQDNVFILGRIKDVIKRSGVPITPAALESCIESYTGAVVSRPLNASLAER